MEQIIRKDPLTGEEFIPKKISQRFACTENRIRYGNLIASRKRQDKAFLDKPMNKNLNIIIEIYVEGGKNIFNIDWMEGKGFRFNATNHKVYHEGKYRDCVYYFMIIQIENTNNIKIIKL